MGTKEVNHAYPRLKREWQSQENGFVMRLSNPQNKGVPDFLLAHPLCGPLFCEVKAVVNLRDKIGLEFHQADKIEKLLLAGAKCKVLVLCFETQNWHIFDCKPDIVKYYTKFTPANATKRRAQLDAQSI